MKRLLLAFHFICAAIFVFAEAASAQKLVIAWTAVSAFNSPFWIMNDADFYKEEGLDVDTMYIASSPIAAKATLAGEVVISAQNSGVIADPACKAGIWSLLALRSISFLFMSWLRRR